MKAEHLNKLTKLLHGARPRLATTHDLEFKNVFGAVGGYVIGNIFVSCGNFGVALKLPPRSIARLLEERGTKHLKYFPRGHVKKDYVVIPRRIIDDSEGFRRLVNSSIRFVSK